MNEKLISTVLAILGFAAIELWIDVKEVQKSQREFLGALPYYKSAMADYEARIRSLEESKYDHEN